MSMPTAAEIEEEKKQKQGVVEYLQAPKRKRKNYVLLAVGPSFDREVSAGIEVYIKKNFDQLAISIPKDEVDLKRLFSRQIVLLVIEDDFNGLERTLEIVASLKEKKKDSVIPVLFLTDRPQQLIQAYHEKLLPYQEVDNYIFYRGIPLTQIYSRIQSALNLSESRRSKRFRVNIPVSYFRLSKNQSYSGTLIDISLHGAVLLGGEDVIFSTSDQFRIQIPSLGLLPPTQGEFFKLSAVVRRVFMGGNKVGISWEYMTENQHLTILRFVSEYINQDMYLQARRAGSS